MPDRILPALAQALAQAPAGALHVGYSGGLDSSVLLHALAQLPQARQRGLVALHIDHGLHPESGSWARHCLGVAARLGLECRLLRVAVRRGGTGPEAAARDARHAAFEQALGAGEVLALAQHRDDQSETVLLKLLRGAGPEGMAAMRPLRPLGAGWLWRPLLDVPRAELRAYAHRHALTWVDDPSNADTRLARNFLRVDILPALRGRWPQLDASLSHAARHARAAADFIDAEASKALARLQGVDPRTLDAPGWRALPEALRDPVLRHWLRSLNLAEPTHLHVAQLERQLAEAEQERLPCIAFAGTEIRRYRDRLYARIAQADPPAQWETIWDGHPLELPASCGRIALVAPDGADLPGGIALRLRFRRGGERLKPAGSPHTRELRDLLQGAGIPPWQRPRLPLVFRGDALWAVADLWRSAAAVDWLDRHGLHLHVDAGADQAISEGFP